jgi:hypothetical protein
MAKTTLSANDEGARGSAHDREAQPPPDLHATVRKFPPPARPSADNAGDPSRRELFPDEIGHERGFDRGRLRR